MPPSQTRWMSRNSGGRLIFSMVVKSGCARVVEPVELAAHPLARELEALDGGRLDEGAEVVAQALGVDLDARLDEARLAQPVEHGVVVVVDGAASGVAR